MSISLRVSKQGYQWRSGIGWEATQDAYIGKGSFFYMTGFSFTPSRALQQISITFRVTPGNSAVRYSMVYPGTGSGASGTDIALSDGENTITVTGEFAQGQSYTLWVWGTGGSWSSYVSSCSGTGEEPPPPPVEDDGLARVYGNGAWNKYEAKLRVNGQWASYEPYVWYNGQWRKMV